MCIVPNGSDNSEQIGDKPDPKISDTDFAYLKFSDQMHDQLICSELENAN